MVTVIHEERETDIAAARVDRDRLWLTNDDVQRATGWTLKREGLCRDDTCVPLPHGRETGLVDGDAIDIAAIWRHLGHPVVSDGAQETWVLGTGARERASALASLQAPDFALPDLDGRVHALADQRGKKVLLVTWASW